MKNSTNLYEEEVISKTFMKKRLGKVASSLALNNTPIRAFLEPSICKVQALSQKKSSGGKLIKVSLDSLPFSLTKECNHCQCWNKRNIKNNSHYIQLVQGAHISISTYLIVHVTLQTRYSRKSCYEIKDQHKLCYLLLNFLVCHVWHRITVRNRRIVDTT